MSKLSSLGASESIFEGTALLIAIFGFLLAMSARTDMSAYIIVLIMGLMLGRIAWVSRKKSKLPMLLLLCAFVAGFLMGNVAGNPVVLVVMMGVGIYWGYEAHRRKWLPFT